MKKILTLISFSISFIGISQWSQKGSDIVAPTGGTGYARSLDLSSNGEILIVGARLYNNNTGCVYVYEWNGSGWVQKGNTITGNNIDDYFGQQVAISGDGETIISSSVNDVRAYIWDGTNYVYTGAPIVSILGEDQDSKIDIDSTGSNVVIGIPNSLEIANGVLKVFEWNGSNWNQKGATLSQTTAGVLGFSVSISTNGNRIAGGSRDASGGFGVAYEWDGAQWQQMGNRIHAALNTSYCGASIDLNGNGSVMVLGTTDGSWTQDKNGQIRVFQYNGVGWVQKGNEIDGEFENGIFGVSSAINYDGDKIVVGDYYADSTVTNGGAFYSYHFSNDEWVRTFDPIYGQAGSGFLGFDVAISANGFIVSAGAHNVGPGLVRIYETEFYLGAGESYSSDLTIYPNPVNGNVFRIDGISVSTPYSIYNLSGQLIESGYTSGIMDVSQINEGMYLLQLHTVEKNYYLKFIKE